MTKILLVEDDESLGQTLLEQLQIEGYQVIWSSTCDQARKHIHQGQFDICILDVTLPDGSGFDLAKELKQTSQTPFLFLTAMSEAENRLLGFELGADEFIPKPFHLKELFLRLKHIIKDHRPTGFIVSVGDKKIDFQAMRILDRDGQALSVGARDFQVLQLLYTQSPKVLSRDEILNQVWGEEKFPTDRSVDNSILRLRQALGDEKGELIRSVRRVGYQWEGGSN